MYAKTKPNMDKVITKIDRLTISPVISATGVDSIITPQDITANTILGYARAMESAHDTEIRALYRMVNGNAEAVEFRITKECALTSVPLRLLNLKKNIIIAVIIKGNKIIIPDGNTIMETGDLLIVLTTGHLRKISELLI